MKKTFIGLSLLFFFSLSLKAQIGECGTQLGLLSEEEQQAALGFYRQRPFVLSRDNATDSVAVTVHIVESSLSGGNGLSQEAIEAELQKANNAFSGAGIVFFLCGSPRVIEGRPSYNFTTGDQLNRTNRIPNTINIYFVDEVFLDVARCGYARFPFWESEEMRYVMMDKNCSTNGATLIHELGHFYGLFHTHETFPGLEFVDGSNCETAGDMICDTPADPNLSLPEVMAGCNYVGRIVDPKGDLYVPSPANIMSYAPAACRRLFTEEQKNVVRAVHENENAYLLRNCDFYPDFAVKTDASELKIRSDEDFTMDYTFVSAGIDKEYEVEFKILLLDDIAGSLLHVEKVRITPGQGAFSRRFDIDFPDTKGAGVYTLQTTIDSELKVIERTEKNNTANTMITVDNSELSDVVIFPNPVDDELKLFIRDDKVSGDAVIRVYYPDGRFILEDKAFKKREEFVRSLNVSHLTTGLYFLEVSFPAADFSSKKSGKKYAFRFLKK